MSLNMMNQRVLLIIEIQTQINGGSIMLFLIWIGIPFSCAIYRNKNIKDGSKMVWTVIMAVLTLFALL